VVDHHVDRPEVEAEQSVQLTGTNRSIGLIHTGAATPRRTTARVQRQASRRAHTPQHQTLPAHLTSHPQGGLPGLVAIARGQTPDPIPNSAVKTLSAHGTAA
jgi:hypothetical protein